MKQHITIKQLNELSDKGKESLRKWWNPKWGQLTTGTAEKESSKFSIIHNSREPGIVVTPEDVQNQLPILSIGQMIEFLDENVEWDESDWIVNTNSVNHIKDGYGARAGFGIKWWMSDDDEEDGELCDVLWLMVKRTLEGELFTTQD